MRARRTVVRVCFSILILALLAGCRPVADVIPSSQPSKLPPSATRTLAPTSTPLLAVARQVSSPTPIPTGSPTPSATPQPTVTPSILSATPISVGSAAGLVERAHWGRGVAGDVRMVGQSGLTAVLTPLGLYLYRLPESEPVKFVAEARLFTISADGSLLAASSTGTSVDVWRVADLEKPIELQFTVEPYKANWEDCLMDPTCKQLYLKALASETESVQGLNFSPDGTRLAVSYGDGRIAIWQTQDGRQVQVLSDPAVTRTTRMAFSPDGRYLAGSDPADWGDKDDFSVWRLEDSKLMRFIEKAGSMSERPFSADGNFVVTGVRGYMVLWNTPFLESPRWLAGTHTEDVQFSEDGQMLVLGGGVELRHYPDGSLLPQPELTPDPRPDAAALAAMGHFVVAGLRVLPQGEIVAWSSGVAQPVTLWRLPGGTPQVLLPAGGALNLPDVSPDGLRLAYCSEAGLMLVELTGGTQARLNTCTQGGSDLHLNLSNAPQLFISDDVLARGEQTQLALLSPDDGAVLHNLLGHTQNLVALAVSPDGTRMVSTTLFEHTRSYIEIAGWDLSVPTRLFRTNWPLTGTPGLAFSPDNRVLAVAAGVVRFYVFDQARLYREVDLPADEDLPFYYPGMASWRLQAKQIAYSPDGALLAVGDASGNLHLLDAKSGAVLASYPAGRAAVNVLAFDPSGANIVVACADGTVSLWGAR